MSCALYYIVTMESEEMVKVEMKLNGKIVGSAEHEDLDVAKNDAIRDYYLFGDHDLSWDEMWDLIEDDEFVFVTK
jgi:hypothetical protein